MFSETDPIPNNPPENTTNFPYDPWITPNAKVTLFLPQHTKKPQQGYLTKHADATWSFSPGRKINNKNAIEPPSF